jgi:hypothetical protein
MRMASMTLTLVMMMEPAQQVEVAEEQLQPMAMGWAQTYKQRMQPCGSGYRQ